MLIFQHRILWFVSAGMLAVSTVACGLAHAIEPLANAHAHNDYWHERPLLDALDHGFTSVEADVFLLDGNLLVGHDRDELRPDRTLESLYLAPLARRVQENNKRVFPNGQRFFLLIDIKSSPQEAYQHLRKELLDYANMLTVIDDGKVRQGAVTVVVSGNRPRVKASEPERRYAGLDGRTSDLDSDVPSHFMPMISDNWTSHFTWNGDGPLPEGEHAKLHEIVRKAHSSDRVVRFWATPENETVWRELRLAGVDLIGTDQLERLAAFLRALEAESPRR
jgi:Glycerophosphoryl diester phosphodiesterase family